MGPQNDRDHVVTGGFDKSCARETMGTRAVEEGIVIVSTTVLGEQAATR